MFFFHSSRMRQLFSSRLTLILVRIADRAYRSVRHFLRAFDRTYNLVRIERSATEAPRPQSGGSGRCISWRAAGIAAFSPFPEFLPWLGIEAPVMKLFAILNLLVRLVLTLVVPLVHAIAISVRTRHSGMLASAIGLRSGCYRRRL